MFWLFKRKKVADKKAITPCVCDNGTEPPPDSLNLQEFGSRSASEGTISSRLEPGGGRRGYQRLTGETPHQPLDPQHPSLLAPAAQPPPPPVERCSTPSCSGSESSCSDNERDFFDGFTDTEDEEEELTCNFCERSFHSVRRLEQHQQRKRHYMCSICDTVFDGLMLLEMHKETLDHWSDYELRVRRATRPDSESDEEELEEHRVYSGAGDELRRLLL